MELPKNITQIGEADKHCRVYVEDYVVSYIKQMNGMAQNKDIAIALYGRKTAEDGVAYLFAYGSAKLNFLQKPVRHLSQAQEQEIEKLRRKYFSEMTFLGYQILNGEMVEGFRICEQEICRYVAGYAQFYEKNDSCRRRGVLISTAIRQLFYFTSSPTAPGTLHRSAPTVLPVHQSQIWLCGFCGEKNACPG